MKKISAFLATCMFASIFCGCGRDPGTETVNEKHVETSGALVTLQETEQEKNKEEEFSVKEQSFFEDRHVEEGCLTYTLEGCGVYRNIQDCGLQTTDFIEVENSYEDIDYLQKFKDISDYISEDGEVDPSHRFVMLNLEIHNEDAVGLIKKNQFNIFGINLVDVDTGDRFFISYFSEAADSPVEGKPHYYRLEQNSTLHVKIGYFVLTDGLEDRRIKLQYGDVLYDWLDGGETDQGQ